MNPRAKDIFLDALDLDGEAERRAFVARACSDDATLLAAVEALLASHAAAATLRPPVPSVGSSLLGADADHVTVAVRTGHAERPGDLIGERYELIRTLGEGGFGVVYLARQREPVVRDVALKLLKGGMDSGQIVARFEAERQTLARMDHPGIARVFDAGATARGRPYFVMEYVDGPPITTYCNTKSLGLHERLRLLEQVCNAVQHAHQKGVIHRDLKPGNLLVAQVDGRATPKVIDFGIAKAVVTDDELGVAQPTMTLEAQIIGTPQYMAPEQATIGPKNIDTRSDVYSLGTVMYELITGAPPFDPGEMRRMGLDQVCQLVRERVPAKPSTRIGSITPGDDRSTWQGFDTNRLSRMVAGEIDWIVMKAMEKEPARRYQTAADLGADIRRYLRHEPVAAGPPSRLYAARKFVRRHRIEVAAAAAVVTALFGTAVVASVKEKQARVAQHEAEVHKTEAQVSAQRARASEAEAIAKADEAARQLTKANAIADFTRQLLNGIGPSVARGRDTSLVKDLLAQAVEHMNDSLTFAPTIDLAVRAMIGKAQFDLGDYDTAIATLRPTYERLREQPEVRTDPERLRAGTQLASMLIDAGKATDAMQILSETTAGFDSLGDRSSDDALAAQVAMASALLHERQYDGAMAIDQRILKQLQDAGRSDGDLALVVASAIGSIHRSRGEIDSAVRDWEALLPRQRARYGDDHPRTLVTMGNLGWAYSETKRYDEAERVDRQILAIERSIYEPGHPNLVRSLNNLGSVLLALNRLNEAEPVLTEAQQIADAKLEPTHRFRLAVEVQLMNLRSMQGRYDEAVELARQIREAYAVQFGDADVRTFAAQTIVLGCLCDASRFAEAGQIIEALGPAPEPAGLAAEQRVTFHAAVADAMFGLGRFDESARHAWQARAAIPIVGDGTPPHVPPRLTKVERQLALRAATQPATQPASEGDAR